MKIPVFIRVAKDRYAQHGPHRVEGTKRYKPDALTDTDGRALPTVHVKVVLDVPDELLQSRPPHEIEVAVAPQDVGWTRVVEVQLPPEPEGT